MTVTTTKPAPKGLQAPPLRPFGPVDAVFLYILGALALVLVLALLVPRALHLSPYVVTSVSMEPTLHRGDLIFVSEIALTDIDAGDLVAYRSDNGVLTHRVFSKEDGAVRTKADASVYLDEAPLTDAQLLGRVAYRIPLVGYLALWLGEAEVGP